MNEAIDSEELKIKPRRQELYRWASGGMAAFSAGLLALWFATDQPITGKIMIGLALNAIAVPLLIFCRMITDILDMFDRVTSRVARAYSLLFWAGIGAAYFGYAFILQSLSLWIFWAFLIGLFVGAGFLRVIINDMEKPEMTRKPEVMGRRPIPRHDRVDLGELSPTVPAPSDGA